MQLLGYLDFPYDTNRNEGEGESILCVAREIGKQNDKLCIVGWAESIFRMMQKMCAGVWPVSNPEVCWTDVTKRDEYFISQAQAFH